MRWGRDDGRRPHEPFVSRSNIDAWLPQRQQEAHRTFLRENIARARWVNFPCGVVEADGQTRAREWTAADSARLTSLVQRAHGQGLRIRFYTLDGFAPDSDRGFTASHNFGSDSAVERRWSAAIATRVDFVATDQYERFVQVRDAGKRR